MNHHHQSALRQVDERRPFRGPDSFELGDFIYHDRSTGNISRFSGIEKVLFNGEEVYSLMYHGGSIIIK